MTSPTIPRSRIGAAVALVRFKFREYRRVYGYLRKGVIEPGNEKDPRFIAWQKEYGMKRTNENR